MIGILAVVFVVLSIISLTRQAPLVIPVSFSQSVKGVKAIFTNNDTAAVEELLREKNVSYLFVTSSKDVEYIVTLPDNAEVFLGSTNIPAQIDSLQLITRRLTMEGKRFIRLDLRFDRPVVVLK